MTTQQSVKVTKVHIIFVVSFISLFLWYQTEIHEKQERRNAIYAEAARQTAEKEAQEAKDELVRGYSVPNANCSAAFTAQSTLSATSFAYGEWEKFIKANNCK